MANISKIKLPSGNEYDIKDNLATHYQGTLGTGGDITTLPTAAASNEGDIYTVIVAGTYASQSAGVGDIFISDGTQWIRVANTEATTGRAGLMSSADKTKLNGIATGAEVNQNAFSTVKVTQGSTSTDVAADSKTDTVELVGGTNVTLTPDATNDKITISAKDTTYTFATGDANGQIKVTPSGGSAQNVDVKGLGTAAYKDYTTSVTSGSSDLVTSGAVATAIADLPEPMVFKGSVGDAGDTPTVTWANLPTPASSGTGKNVGWTYKVVTKHTTAPICEVGDTIISDGTSWVVIPSGDEPSGTVTSVGVANATNGGLTVSGSPITSSGTITVGHTNVITAGTAKGDDDKTLTFGGTFTVPSVTYDVNGHITSKSSTTMTMPANPNTDRYVNSASFANDSTNGNVKMTLTRAGSDTATVTANIPAVSKDTAGVAPKGAAVTTQSQTTKFLREDGSWAAPSYTTNTDRYVNTAAFADDSTSSASSPVKMTLTRAGSDTATVTGNIPKVSATSAGVAPKGASVTSQSQTTKFLREDGTWAAPSYTQNTNTTYTFDEGSTDGAFQVTPSNGSAQTVKVHNAVTSVDYDTTNKKFTQTIDGTATDIATLSTTSIIGVSSSTTTASKATAGTAVAVATTDTAKTVATGTLGAETTTRGTDTPMWGATVTDEVLSFTFKPLSTDSVTPAKSNGTITPYTFADVTVPIKSSSSTTVATGFTTT